MSNYRPFGYDAQAAYLYACAIQSLNLPTEGRPHGAGILASKAHAAYERALVAFQEKVDKGEASRPAGLRQASNPDFLADVGEELAKLLPEGMEAPGWLSEMADRSRTGPCGYALARVAEMQAFSGMDVIPLSPFHPDLKNRDVFLRNGSNLLYASAADERSGSLFPVITRRNQAGVITGMDLDNLAASDVRLYRDGLNSSVRRDGETLVRLDPETGARTVTPMGRELKARGYLSKFGVQVQGNLQMGSKSDPTGEIALRSGMSRLRPFMSEAEYDAIMAPHTDPVTGQSGCWMAQFHTRGERPGAGPTYMPEPVIERCVALVKLLREEGIPFTVQRDRRPGQVCLQFENKTEMRIIDPEKDGQYAGNRVYDYRTGRSFYYHIVDPSAKNSKPVPVPERMMTPEMGLNVIRASMGYEVPDTSRTFHVTNGHTMRFMTNKKAGNGAVVSMCVNVEAPRNKALTMDPASEQFAGKFVADAVRTARERTAAGLHLDEIVTTFVNQRGNLARFEEAVERYKIQSSQPGFTGHAPTEDEYGLVPPAWSSDEELAKYQQDLWNILQANPVDQAAMGQVTSEASEDMGEGLVSQMEALSARLRELQAERPSGELDEGQYQEVLRMVDGISESIQDEFIGNVEFDADWKPVQSEANTFHGSRTSMYMSRSTGVVGGSERLAEAMRMMGMDERYCREGDFQEGSFRESLLRFDDGRDADVADIKKFYGRGAVAAARRAAEKGEALSESDLAKYEIPGPVPGFSYDENGMPTHWPISEDGDPQVREMGEVLKAALIRNGIDASPDVLTPDKIQIDMNGSVRYEVRRILGADVDSPYYDVVTGEIGPFFRQVGEYGLDDQGRDTYNVLYDGLYDNGKKYFVPGAEAYIRANKDGEDLPYEQRLSFRPYSRILAEAVYQRVQSDLLKHSWSNKDVDGGYEPQHVGYATSVKYATKKVYDALYDHDFIERDRAQGMSEELRDSIIGTNKARVRINAMQMEESSRVNLFREGKTGIDPLNDNYMDGMFLTGGENPAILRPEGDVYFDPIFTGNGGSIGIRYLKEGVRLLPDGTVARKSEEELEAIRAKGHDPERCQVMNYLIKSGRCPDNDAIDRAVMSGQGLIHGLRETEREGVIQMSLGMMTLEDGIVVSDTFAGKYQVLDVDGNMRPLKTGDKMDSHGNKGVIGAVITTREGIYQRYLRENPGFAASMSEEELRHSVDEEFEALLYTTRENNPILARVMDVFDRNPNLSVCMSPYSSVSRMNGGLAAETMQPGAVVDDLVVPTYDENGEPNGETVHKGCLGRIKLTILEQTVDTKTHYNEDGDPDRAYGAQMSWALAAADAQEVMKDSYQYNDRALANVRELLLSTGVDMDEQANMFEIDYDAPDPATGARGYIPHVVKYDAEGKPIREERPVFEVPDVTVEDIRDEWRRASGYQAKLDKDGKPLPQREPSKASVWNKGSGLKGRMLEEFGSFANESGGFVKLPFKLRMPTGKETDLLPVMSARMRSGREYREQGETRMSVHDYTRWYNEILDCAWMYNACRPRPELDGKSVTSQFVGSIDKVPVETYFSELQSRAQSSFDKITRDISSRWFSGKYNIFRRSLMSARQRNSVTAVMTPDPTIPVDAVKMSGDMMSALGLNPENTAPQYTLIHRDPVLQESGVRDMRVIRDDDMIGIAVHPAGIPGGMDGDFDGDTVGGHTPGSEAAKAEAHRKLTVQSNLLAHGEQIDLDTGLRDPAHPDAPLPAFSLFIAGGQDIAAAHAVDPGLAEQRQALLMRVNKIEQAYKYKIPVSLEEGAEPVMVVDWNDVPAGGMYPGGVKCAVVSRLRQQAMHDIDAYLKSCSLSGFGRHVISYDSPEAHLMSIQSFVLDKAKGSVGKVVAYAAHAGMTVETELADPSDPKSLRITHADWAHEDHRSVALRSEHIGILKSKEFQQEYTGVAGAVSINGMRVLTDICPDSITAITKLATQAVLQCKHDPGMADDYEYVLQEPMRRALNGQSLDGSYKRDGLTPDEFKAQLIEVYETQMGLSVSRMHLDIIARALTNDTGHVNGISSDAARALAPQLRILAYNGTVDDIIKFAKENSAARSKGEEDKIRGLYTLPDAAKPLARANYALCMAGATTRANLENPERATGIYARDTQASRLLSRTAEAAPSVDMYSDPEADRNLLGQVYVTMPDGTVDVHRYALRAPRDEYLTPDDVTAGMRRFGGDVAFLRAVNPDIQYAAGTIQAQGWDLDESDVKTAQDMQANVAGTLVSTLARQAVSGEPVSIGDPKARYAVSYQEQGENGRLHIRYCDDKNQMLSCLDATMMAMAGLGAEARGKVDLSIPEGEPETMYDAYVVINSFGPEPVLDFAAWKEAMDGSRHLNGQLDALMDEPSAGVTGRYVMGGLAFDAEHEDRKTGEKVTRDAAYVRSRRNFIEATGVNPMPAGSALLTPMPGAGSDAFLSDCCRDASAYGKDGAICFAPMGSGWWTPVVVRTDPETGEPHVAAASEAYYMTGLRKLMGKGPEFREGLHDDINRIFDGCCTGQDAESGKHSYEISDEVLDYISGAGEKYGEYGESARQVLLHVYYGMVADENVPGNTMGRTVKMAAVEQLYDDAAKGVPSDVYAICNKDRNRSEIELLEEYEAKGIVSEKTAEMDRDEFYEDEYGFSPAPKELSEEAKQALREMGLLHDEPEVQAAGPDDEFEAGEPVPERMAGDGMPPVGPEQDMPEMDAALTGPFAEVPADQLSPEARAIISAAADEAVRDMEEGPRVLESDGNPLSGLVMGGEPKAVQLPVREPVPVEARPAGATQAADVHAAMARGEERAVPAMGPMSGIDVSRPAVPAVPDTRPQAASVFKAPAQPVAPVSGPKRAEWTCESGLPCEARFGVLSYDADGLDAKVWTGSPEQMMASAEFLAKVIEDKKGQAWLQSHLKGSARTGSEHRAIVGEMLRGNTIDHEQHSVVYGPRTVQPGQAPIASLCYHPSGDPTRFYTRQYYGRGELAQLKYDAAVVCHVAGLEHGPVQGGPVDLTVHDRRTVTVRDEYDIGHAVYERIAGREPKPFADWLYETDERNKAPEGESLQ